jgi:Tfp pilus assembly protein PilF
MKPYAGLHRIIATLLFLLITISASAQERELSKSSNIDVLTEAIRVNPNNIFALFKRAFIYADRGDKDRALEDFGAVIAASDKFPYRAEAYKGRGSVFLRSSEYQKAVDDFSAALKIDRALWEAYLGRAEALLRQGRSAEALADSNQVLWLQPYFATAYITRARIYGSLGRAPDAAVDSARAAALQTAPPGPSPSRQTIRSEFYASSPENCSEDDKYLIQLVVSQGKVTVRPFYTGIETEVPIWRDGGKVSVTLGREGCRIEVAISRGPVQANDAESRLSQLSRIRLIAGMEPQVFSHVFYKEPLIGCANSKIVVRSYWGFVELEEERNASKLERNPRGDTVRQYGQDGCAIIVEISRLD